MRLCGTPAGKCPFLGSMAADLHRSCPQTVSDRISKLFPQPYFPGIIDIKISAVDFVQ